MKNSSMLKISSNLWVMPKYFILIFPLVWCVYLLIVEGFAVFGHLIFTLAIILVVFRALRYWQIADSVWESADGTFLRVRINLTEKTLPLSAIESVEVYRVPFYYGLYRNRLQIKVKHQLSPNGFPSGTVFYLNPQKNYFRSALFRQFPNPGGIKSIGDLWD
jgi:hypothetical protein